jgi:hypothetical protein
LTIRKEKEEAIDASKIQASLVWNNNEQQRTTRHHHHHHRRNDE